MDVCPLNFKGVDSLPGSAMIDLDRLNTTLTAINGLFVADHAGPSPFPERIDMTQVLLETLSKTEIPFANA